MVSSCEWTIDRVRNYTKENVEEYIEFLNKCAGDKYDTAKLGKQLYEMGYINISDIDDLSEEKKSKKFSRKWGSYIGPMTALGLATKFDGTLELSEISRLYLNGKLDYEDLLTHQLFKYQIPNGSMSDVKLKYLVEQNTKIKPYVLIIKILLNLVIDSRHEPWLDRYEIKEFVSEIDNHIDNKKAISKVIKKICSNRCDNYNFNERNISREDVKEVVTAYDIFENAFVNTKYLHLKDIIVLDDGEEKKLEVLSLNMEKIEQIKKFIDYFGNKFIEFDTTSDNEIKWQTYYGEYDGDFFEDDIDEFKKDEKLIDVNYDIDLVLNGLYFPKLEKDRLINQIKINLKQGKHIILTGPPGTGKSKIAKKICRQYVGNDNFKMVTATSDWSTFDTIGGYRPDKDNQLFFSSGIFLDCFKSEENNLINNWLVIDELNRADIDKAFGPLFSTLTGDPISLSFKDIDGNNINILPENDFNDDFSKIKNYQYIIPKDWRIIATMNTFDKTSLYEMSYAFMRRFAFIPVSIPDKIDEDLLKKYLDCWKISDYSFVSKITYLWKKINDVRPIGPAIVEDIYKYLLGQPDSEKPDYASAIINYVLPQFEGLTQEKLNEFIDDETDEFDFIDDWEVVRKFVRDYFHLGEI